MPLPQLLVGKVAAVTGGLTGIGRAIALAYIHHGAKVAVSHLGGPKEDELLASLRKDVNEIEAGAETSRFITVAGNISQPETGVNFVAKVVETFGRLDVFVSNAGVCQFADFLELEPSLFNHTVSTNLSGAFFATQAAARQMALTQSPPGGSIIGISSISALVGGGEQVHYTRPRRVSLASCSHALLHWLNDADMSDPVKREYMEGRIPLGRLGQPPDLAGPAVFLACEELSNYVTGAQILVDGGLFVNLQ
ncbi:hypothetical protein N7470_007051 [Penicillium chermesinum]|nr:hypothetical protein N7470_007051 [Penicillium chermesinum]